MYSGISLGMCRSGSSHDHGTGDQWNSVLYLYLDEGAAFTAFPFRLPASQPGSTDYDDDGSADGTSVFHHCHRKYGYAVRQ